VLKYSLMVFLPQFLRQSRLPPLRSRPIKLRPASSVVELQPALRVCHVHRWAAPPSNNSEILSC